MNNLPDGVSTSSIPGNSRRELVSERAMEEAEHEMGGICESLGLVSGTLSRAFLHSGAEDVQSIVRAAREALEKVDVKLEEASGILDRVTMPDEPDYDPCP